MTGGVGGIRFGDCGSGWKIDAAAATGPPASTGAGDATVSEEDAGGMERTTAATGSMTTGGTINNGATTFGESKTITGDSAGVTTGTTVTTTGVTGTSLVGVGASMTGLLARTVGVCRRCIGPRCD